MQDLDDDAMEEVATFFAALGVPMRLKILSELRRGERNVSELTSALGGSQANVSKHLSLLAQHGLIAKTVRGTSAFYRIADPRIFHLCDLVCVQVGTRLAAQAEAKRVSSLALHAAGVPAAKRRARR